eukprot:7668767-Pyramimonas_sp.AAC.1
MSSLRPQEAPRRPQEYGPTNYPLAGPAEEGGHPLFHKQGVTQRSSKRRHCIGCHSATRTMQ